MTALSPGLATIPVASLLAKVSELRRAAETSRSLRRDGVVSDRKEVARLRRVIMGLMVEIAALARDIPDPEERAAFTLRFAQLRSRNADHHSSWPVVTIDLDDQTYDASIRRVRDAYESFFRFVDDRYGATP